MARKRTRGNKASGRSPKDFARRFPENGMKLLLEDALNARDVLQLTTCRLVPLIQFDGLRRVQTTFVKRDYRHVECDVVFVAPFGRPRKSGKAATILVYILIEHQSEPEELMPLRVLEYVTQMYTSQERQWRREHGTVSNMRFAPVLPVVFYTGSRRWENLGRLADLIEMGEQFGGLIPSLEPEFLNLSALAEDTLTTAGGFLADYFMWFSSDIGRRLRSRRCCGGKCPSWSL
jgi:hypothetical protein